MQGLFGSPSTFARAKERDALISDQSLSKDPGCNREINGPYKGALHLHSIRTNYTGILLLRFVFHIPTPILVYITTCHLLYTLSLYIYIRKYILYKMSLRFKAWAFLFDSRLCDALGVPGTRSEDEFRIGGFRV